MNLTVNLHGERRCNDTHQVDYRPGRYTGRTYLCEMPSFLARTTNLGSDKEGRFRIGSLHAQSGLVRPRGRQIQHGRVPDEVFTTGQQTDHPLRAIRVLADEALRSMSIQLERLYSTTGRLSIPPEQLQRALLFQVLCRVRSERLLMEELDYNPLFRWFVALNRTESDDAWQESGPVAGRRGCGELLRRNQLSGACGGSALRRALHRRRARLWSL